MPDARTAEERSNEDRNFCMQFVNALNLGLADEDLKKIFKLGSLIESVSTKFSNFILVGDFNFNDIDWYKWCSLQNKASSCQFLNALKDNLLLQHIDVPTRRRGMDNPHVLDLVITNNEIVGDINYLAPLGKVIIKF